MFRAKAYAFGMIMAFHAPLLARDVPACIAMRAKADALGMLMAVHAPLLARAVRLAAEKDHVAWPMLTCVADTASGSERGGGSAGEGYIAA